MSIEQRAGLVQLTAGIVSSFLSSNTVRPAELAGLIASVHASLKAAGTQNLPEAAAAEAKPAVPVKKSITHDYLICLDDGKRFQSLKRHLALLGMTPDEYRAKWRLPGSYPMVAPGYAAKRSALAKASGLGEARRKGLAASAVSAVASDVPDTAEAPARKRARPRKAA